jgi:hypothetical protein
MDRSMDNEASLDLSQCNSDQDSKHIASGSLDDRISVSRGGSRTSMVLYADGLTAGVQQVAMNAGAKHDRFFDGHEPVDVYHCSFEWRR